jgi:hypothetical protein
MAAISNRTTKTRRPIYDSRGLVVGYTNEGASTNTGRSYTAGTGTGGVAPSATGMAAAPSGMPVSAGTPRAVTPAVPEFTVTRTVKNPAITGAVDAAIANQQTTGQQLTKTFQDFMEEARQINAQAKTQLAKDQQAFNTTNIERELPAINRNYEAGQNQVSADIAASNRDYAAETRATLERLSNENRAYETAAQAVAAQAVAQAQKRNNLFQLTTGTPTSNSGAMTNRAIRAYQDINVPLQRELSDRRYRQISDIERPLNRELYGNDQALLARQSSLESDFAGRQADTARYLQTLKMQVAGMERAQAQDYLRNLGLPFEIAQRVISGEIANLGALQGLDQAANFYTLNTPFDSSRFPELQYFPLNTPQRDYLPRDPQLPNLNSNPVPSGGGNGGFVPPAAQNRSDPVNIAYFRETGAWPDQRYDQATWMRIYFRQRNTPRNSSGITVQNGVADLPNDYSFGRDPLAQAAYQALQNSFE